MKFVRTFEAKPRVWLTSLVALLALPAALIAAPAPASAGKLSVTMSVELAASPRDVWSVVGAFDKLQGWHPAVASTTMEGSPTQPGAVRILHLNGGGDINETLTSYNDQDTRMTYVINESPLPVANYESFIAITHTGKGHALVIWGSTFDAAGGADDAKAKSVIAGVYKAGFDTLRKKFGK
jgi:mxaD protein